MKTTKELVKFDVETAVITTLDAEYKEVQKITDVKSKAIVAEGRQKYRELRLAVIEGHHDEKREALDHCNFLDAEKRRILGLLAPGESHLNDIWQTHKDEQDRKERERIEAIQETINSIRSQGMVHGGTSSTIKERLIIVKAMKISKEVYQESTDQAIECQKVAIGALEEFLSRSLQTEKEDAERKADAERLEAQRKEQAEAQAKIDEKIRKVELRQHELEEKERKAEVQKAQQDFERQALIKAEQEAKEKGAREEQEKIDKEEAQAKEKARIEALKPDRQKLIAFANDILEVHIPELKSTQAIQVLHEGQSRLNELSADIKEQAKEL